MERRVEKQLPGREAEYMVYDLGDRLIMSQDGNLRAQDQWIVYCYDDFGRLTEQRLGTVPDSSEGPTREDNGGKGSISIPGNKDSKATYHSHMSATFVKDGAIKGSSRGPSMTDYKSIQGRQGYIFQMRTQEIIVFDKSGIKATLPFSVLK